ncbi:PHP domain-containing protein [Streptomyces sp. 7-21]|uniref:PHP domain-containing protein n=1 Tax=Streptomyces sp. 7-21 TaxID=2802283 RepID=UPI00191FC0D9|nr:PHP domain-containing protein [Streptomyces sp. 7-21]MBL1066299.1 PHP domain-containing protein [Streptomyces sp. 7-21]
MRIDLHTHSDASDGSESPTELIRNAKTAGLDVIGLTDHDTVAGHAEAAAALPPGMTLVTGAELSCRLDGVSIHMLGYLFDPDEPELAAQRDLLRDDRIPRAKAIVAKLRDLGADVTWEQVQRHAGDGAVGRPHIAAAMVESGVVDSVSAAFTQEWIADGGRAHVDKHELDAFEAVRMIRNAGGVAVFAHPFAVLRGRVVPESAIVRLAEAGLAGLEVDHYDHDAAARKRLREMAADLGLFVTGSSDYHGDRKDVGLGNDLTSPEALEELVSKATGARPLTA